MSSSRRPVRTHVSRQHGFAAMAPMGPKPFQPMLSRKELDDLWTATLKDIFIAWSQQATTTPSLPPRSNPSAEL
ncbi:MAG: hypothetical protein KC590_11535 [Nitrospira sp.]|nr:hypothetical protein [Nitrospira sp.]